MAVKKAKMIARFKVKFPKINLSKERMDMIMDKLRLKPEDDSEDSAIDEILDDYNEIFPFEEIAKQDDRIRKAEDDKKKAEDELNKSRSRKSDEDDEDDEDDDPSKLPDDAPQWAKDLEASTIKSNKENKALKEELDKIKSGRETDTTNKQLKGLFEGSEVLKGMTPELKESWMKRFDPKSETSMEDQVAALETEYGTLIQTGNDQNRYAVGAGEGKAGDKVSQEAVDEVLDKMNI